MRQHGFEYWGNNISHNANFSHLEAFVPLYSTGGSSTLLHVAPTDMTTVSIYIPTSTSVVWTTVFSTTFVTLPPTSHTSSSSASLKVSSSQSLPSIVQSTDSSYSTHTSNLISSRTPLPSIVSATPASTTSAASSGSASPEHTVQKHAIIGGLSGAIAGLALVGLLIFLVLRKRRRKSEYPVSDDSSEKTMHAPAAREWSDLNDSGLRRPELPCQPSQERAPVIDNHIIRVSQNRWPRPFVGSEGLRESMGPQQLHVTNPDPSRSGTPASVGTPGRSLPWQRPALAAALFRPRSRSRASSRSQTSRGFHELPAITIEPALSRECILSDKPPSVRSYASFSTSPIVTHQLPEDPFITPPDEEPPQPMQQRPDLSRLHTGRPTISMLGGHLRPSQAKHAQLMPTARIVSSSSASTVSSGWPSTRTRSDPFDLDERHARMEDDSDGNSRIRGQTPNWMLYEGT